jgi:predicted peptidase
MYRTEEFKYKNLSYLVLTHESCSVPDQKHPTLLYLHGAGSRGNTTDTLRTSAILKYADELNIGLRIFAPLCHADTWFELFEQLIDFTEFAFSDPCTDPNRFYLTGVSMGGYAAWQLAMSRPDLFAAAAPVCGGGMYWNAPRMAKIPVWAFHGELDQTVLPTESYHMVNAINLSGGSAKLTTYPEAAHNAWDPTYQNPEFWEWLLSRHK